MALTAPPTAPTASMTQAEFDAAAYALVSWHATNVTELGALQTNLNAVAVGGAYAIPYTFSSTTADADPGAGYMRLDNAAQRLSTAIRLDLSGSDAVDRTALLDTFDDSTNTVKGHIRLVKLGDASKWLVFSVSAMASPTGYRNLTVACVAYSSASPFADGDALILAFQRSGDQGAVGPAGTATGSILFLASNYGGF